MNIEAVQALGMHDEIAPAALPRPQATSVEGPSFLQRVSEGLKEVNQQLLASQVDLQHLAVGDAETLHEIMIRLEEGRISLQLMMQVRNRVLEAYQEVMRMQV
jgi:flagellar hook-basal body complex protein FliE